ncbi:polysaccharide deacetylase family protein [Zunongwangia sp. H14]|uniref:polysaccharide deacetylase family protein n=1 Tax=Zunongwangia sp. H14 TaxID=3240792 RepID=UPI0035670830
MVITYHKFFNTLNFERQIQYLIFKFDLENKEKWKAGEKKKLIITADDGDPSFYYKAFPVLKKYNIPAILFVVTDLINTNTPFWWDEIEYYLGKEEGNKKVWEVKTWPNKQREIFLVNLRKNSDKPALKYPQLTTAHLKEMQDGGITIANHSHTHPMFDHCSPEELENEMERSTTILKELGFSPEVFAYPNGNFSFESEIILKKYGIKTAFLFDHKINSNINPLRVSRLTVDDTTPFWKFKFIISGWHSRILPITKAVAKMRK